MADSRHQAWFQFVAYRNISNPFALSVEGSLEEVSQ